MSGESRGNPCGPTRAPSFTGAGAGAADRPLDAIQLGAHAAELNEQRLARRVELLDGFHFLLDLRRKEPLGLRQ
jgi:hypothetical protein